VSANLFRFGGFEVDPANFQLRRSGRPLRLERIPLEVLLLLVQRHGQLVRRQEIAESVWGGDVVLDVDNAVNTAIRKVRRALGDNPEHARYVETVPTKGYRFISAVTSVPRDDAEGVAEIGRAKHDSQPALRVRASLPADIAEQSVEKTSASKGLAEGERKQVTVLFAELKDSMERLAECDPEEEREIMDPMLDRMIEAVHSFEGTVSQVTEDGILAHFGAPLAHEDHAVRACYAALRMQESVKRHADGVSSPEGGVIQVGIGINSGEIVVRAISPDQPLEPLPVSHTTQLAARLAQLAPSGSVLATADTLRLVEGYVHVTSFGPMSVKGLRGAVDVYQLTERGAVRSQLQAAAARGFSRFVGRDIEMMQLERALEQTRDGRGQAVAIVGDPGVGKSRLVFELTRSPRVKDWLVLEARSVSYGKETAYLPVIELLKGYFRIGDRDTHHDIREKVTEKILALDRALERTLPALLALLDVPVDDRQWQALDAPQRRQRTMDAVKSVLLREAQVQPVLVVFEDLHWTDSESQALLDGLIESLPAARLLLLVNYRPEYRHGWGSRTFYTQLRLDTLPPKSAGELLDVLLGQSASLEPLKGLLAGKTGGNPFFIEESVRTLVETKALVGERGAYDLALPVETIRVPATVQAILAARLDRLPPQEKRLLEIAAVIGKDFPSALLQTVADEKEETLRQALGHLQTAEFLYETNFSPDHEYTFKHGLTQEVAYRSLLRTRRRDLHARTAEAIERLYGDRLVEQVERLAEHALRGELREKAVRYLRQAGIKAFARSVLPDARAWFEQALSVIDNLPESQTILEQAFEIRLELRPVLNQLGEVPRTLERLREAEALAERLNDDRRRGRVCAFMTNVHSLLGELDKALMAGTRALEIAGRLGDVRLRILTTTQLEQAHYLRGEYERVIELAAGNLAAMPADSPFETLGGALPISIYDRYRMLQSLTELGGFAAAAPHEAEALRLAELTHNAYTVGMVQNAAGWLHCLKGDWATARSLIERGLAVFRTGNVVWELPEMVAASAWVLAQVGEASEALTRLREGEQLLDRDAAKGTLYFHAPASRLLSRAALRLGRLDEARSLGDRALEYSLSRRGTAAHTLHLLGDIATHPDRFDAESGEAHYRQALALAEPRGMRPLIAHCHLGLGKLYRRTKNRPMAQEHLITATTMYRDMDMRYWLKETEREINHLA
jgi:class 3 adenylate cyclase/tetratricopeptide (TPR) repeat protein